MSFKIYTKTGDKGQTSLIGGTRVSKDHYRIEAYGTIDELNSCIGLVKDVCNSEVSSLVLAEIQDRLFTIGSLFAADPNKSKMLLPEIKESDIGFLESEIDRIDKIVPPLKSFILPGGHTSISFCHLARCVCRRAERVSITLDNHEKINPLTLIYLNRLSDYLFILARLLHKELVINETNWKPRI